MEFYYFRPGKNWVKYLSTMILNFVWWLGRTIKKRQSELPKDPAKILIILGGFLGDIITLTPSIRVLKEHLPDVEVTLFTNPANREYIEGCPYIDRFIFLKEPLEFRNRINIIKFIDVIREMRKEKYDIVLEMTGTFRRQLLLLFLRYSYSLGISDANCLILDKKVKGERKHQVFRYFDVVKELLKLYNRNVNLNDEYTYYNPTSEKERDKITNFLKNRKVNNFCILHATAGLKLRSWQYQNFIKVANFITSKKIYIFFIGTRKEKQEIEKIREKVKRQDLVQNIAGEFSIREIISLMEKALFFIGNDSGPMHLAKIAKLKSIILFGPGDHIVWGYPEHIIIRKNLPCSPCPQFGFNICWRYLSVRCKILDMITSQEVIQYISEIL